MGQQRPAPLSSEELRLIFQSEDTTDSIVREVAAAFKKEVQEIMGGNDRKPQAGNKQKRPQEGAARSSDKVEAQKRP